MSNRTARPEALPGKEPPDRRRKLGRCKETGDTVPVPGVALVYVCVDRTLRAVRCKRVQVSQPGLVSHQHVRRVSEPAGIAGRGLAAVAQVEHSNPHLVTGRVKSRL